MTMLDFAVKAEKNLLDVLLCVQHCVQVVRVSRAFARNLCGNGQVSLAVTTSVMAGGVGGSLPARPDVNFLALLIVLPGT